jgi:hypothetical protein
MSFSLSTELPPQAKNVLARRGSSREYIDPRFFDRDQFQVVLAGGFFVPAKANDVCVVIKQYAYFLIVIPGTMDEKNSETNTRSRRDPDQILEYLRQNIHVNVEFDNFYPKDQISIKPDFDRATGSLYIKILPIVQSLNPVTAVFSFCDTRSGRAGSVTTCGIKILAQSQAEKIEEKTRGKRCVFGPYYQKSKGGHSAVSSNICASVTCMSTFDWMCSLPLLPAQHEKKDTAATPFGSRGFPVPAEVVPRVTQTPAPLLARVTEPRNQPAPPPPVISEKRKSQGSERVHENPQKRNQQRNDETVLYVSSNAPFSKPTIVSSTLASKPTVTCSGTIPTPTVPTNAPFSKPTIVSSTLFSKPTVPTNAPFSKPTIVSSTLFSKPTIVSSTLFSKPTVLCSGTIPKPNTVDVPAAALSPPFFPPVQYELLGASSVGEKYDLFGENGYILDEILTL